MKSAKVFMLAVAATTLLVAVFIGTVLGGTPTDSALFGKVTSQEGAAIEGVIVGAKRAGSTITTWVVTNDQGQYSFPRERLEPGNYAISIRAVGYELPSKSVYVTGRSIQSDLLLGRITDKFNLAKQLSNAEWLMSIPGTEEQKVAFGDCTECHTVQRILFSHYTDDEMVQIVERMARHANNASPLHPWYRQIRGYDGPPTPKQMALAKYISTINLSSTGGFEFPFKTLPRPIGKATQVIYTTYDLPRPDAAPHDTALDAQGNVWYSDFNSQFIGKLDPKTGKVVEYAVPLGRPGPLAQGGLQIAFDKEGRVYYGNMSQMQIVRFDPKTEKMETFKPPVEESDMGDAHLSMIDPSFEYVDGKIWINVAGGRTEAGGPRGKAGGTWQVNLASNTWTRVTYPPGSPPAGAYDVVANSGNDMYGMTIGNDKIWMTDGKNLRTVWYDLPGRGTGCRRGHIDFKDRLWCAGFNGNDLIMFDPKTQKITEWKAPTEWSRPYDTEFDDKTYLWAAGMDNDIALRLNIDTGEFTQYLLPHETNVRHVDVQKSGALSSLWIGDQEGARIVRVEPLSP